MEAAQNERAWHYHSADRKVGEGSQQARSTRRKGMWRGRRWMRGVLRRTGSKGASFPGDHGKRRPSVAIAGRIRWPESFGSSCRQRLAHMKHIAIVAAMEREIATFVSGW